MYNVHVLTAVKDSKGLKTPGIYSVPGKHGKGYVGQMGKLHMRHLSLGQQDKPAMVEHIMDMGHHVQFNRSYRLNKATTYVDYMV